MPTILGELRRHFRDRTWSVRVPRELQELTVRVDRTVTDGR
jgi:RNA polymerase sigma-B factor